MKPTIVAVSILVAAFAIAGPEDGPGAPAPAAPSRILVFDLQRAIEKCDEANAKNEELSQKKAAAQKSLNDEMNPLKEKVQRLKAKSLAEADEEFFAELREVNKKMGELQGRAEEHNARTGHELVMNVQGRWREAKTIGLEILKERGGEILLISRTGPLTLGTEDLLTQEIMLRRAFVRDEAQQDITEEVIRRMNKQFAERAGGR